MRRRWDHPKRAHVDYGSAYFDITLLELGMIVMKNLNIEGVQGNFPMMNIDDFYANF